MGRQNLKRVLLDILAFKSPQAKVFNISTIFLILFLWPTEKLQYIPVRSLWETMFGFEPYSSGMMRGLSRLMHGDVAGALEFNVLSPIVLGLFVLVLLHSVYLCYRHYRKTRLY